MEEKVIRIQSIQRGRQARRQLQKQKLHLEQEQKGTLDSKIDTLTAEQEKEVQRRVDDIRRTLEHEYKENLSRAKADMRSHFSKDLQAEVSKLKKEVTTDSLII